MIGQAKPAPQPTPADAEPQARPPHPPPPVRPERGNAAAQREAVAPEAVPLEIGGRAGPDPTRYGDWEKNGRCIDF